MAPNESPSDALISGKLHPRSALVCDYRGPYGQQPSHSRALKDHAELGAAAAAAISFAAAAVSVTKPPAGTVNCPADFGTTTVITFTYDHAATVSLWWHTSGCQTLDNGRIQASQLANPSFERFQAMFKRSLRDP